MLFLVLLGRMKHVLAANQNGQDAEKETDEKHRAAGHVQIVPLVIKVLEQLAGPFELDVGENELAQSPFKKSVYKK